MKLIVQPDAGIAPIITAIKLARKTIDIMIFRLDRIEVTRALEAAVARGVAVRALIAHTNSGGERTLRKLELRLLEQGVSVSRTADDLVRYHAKMFIIDRRVLHVYGFNFTGLDIERSRSFGLSTKNPKLVLEATRLFEADLARQPYLPASGRLIVSPETARDRIAEFIRGARRQLLIYDPKVSDPAMVRLLTERAAQGVDVRIIGRVAVKKAPLTAERYPGKRLHVRAIVRDGRQAFVGSQSLRKIELEQRREVGIIASERSVVKQIQSIFEEDWAETVAGRKAARKSRRQGGSTPARAIAAHDDRSRSRSRATSRTRRRTAG
ncbi:MAG: phospholipase D-like domain-containing protein [Acidobacteriota bacterium]